jgi:hypothetical protein
MGALLALSVAGLAMTLDEALALFGEGDIIKVSYDAAGQAKLEQAIAAFKTALAVPADLDEVGDKDVWTTENWPKSAIGQFPVDPSKKGIVNKLSQAYYTLANTFLDRTEKNEVRVAMYAKGRNWGLKSLRMNPDFVALEGKGGQDAFVEASKAETDVAALYWATANWLRVAQFDKLQAVKDGVPGKAKTMSERTLVIAPTYMAYGPWRSLGAFWGGLPSDLLTKALGWGQDLDRARTYLCQVVSEPALCPDCTTCPIDPSCKEYFENRTFFVEFYLIEKKMWQDSARILQAVLAEPIGEKYTLYNAMSQDNARTLLEKVNKELNKK